MMVVKSTMTMLLLMCCLVVCHAADINISAQAKADVESLIKKASSLSKAWPWQKPIPETLLVAAHGKEVAPYLVSLLKVEKGKHLGKIDFDVHVEQQLELTLCTLYGLTPTSGKTVYGIRSTDDENSLVKEFWKNKISEHLNGGAQHGAAPGAQKPARP